MCSDRLKLLSFFFLLQYFFISFMFLFVCGLAVSCALLEDASHFGIVGI